MSFSNLTTTAVISVTEEQISNILQEALLRDFPEYRQSDIETTYKDNPVYAIGYSGELEIGKRITAEVTIKVK